MEINRRYLTFRGFKNEFDALLILIYFVIVLISESFGERPKIIKMLKD